MTTEPTTALTVPAKLRGRQPKWKKAEVVQAVIDCDGNYSRAAKLLAERHGRPCHRNTVAHIIDSIPGIKEVIADIEEQVFDAAYQVIKDRIKDGNLQAALEIFRRKGHKYGHPAPPKQTEVSGNVEVEQRILMQELQVKVKAMSADEIARVIQRGKEAEQPPSSTLNTKPCGVASADGFIAGRGHPRMPRFEERLWPVIVIRVREHLASGGA